MPPDPKITTVAELEPYGLTTRSLVILDDLGFVTIKDMEEADEEYILTHLNSAEKTVQNIRDALRNYIAGKVVVTEHQLRFPPQPKKKRRRRHERPNAIARGSGVYGSVVRR